MEQRGKDLNWHSGLGLGMKDSGLLVLRWVNPYLSLLSLLCNGLTTVIALATPWNYWEGQIKERSSHLELTTLLEVHSTGYP